MFESRYYVEANGDDYTVEFEMFKSQLFKYGEGISVVVSINADTVEVNDTRYVTKTTTQEGFEEYCENWIRIWYGDKAKMKNVFTKEKDKT